MQFSRRTLPPLPPTTIACAVRCAPHNNTTSPLARLPALVAPPLPPFSAAATATHGRSVADCCFGGGGRGGRVIILDHFENLSFAFGARCSFWLRGLEAQCAASTCMIPGNTWYSTRGRPLHITTPGHANRLSGHMRSSRFVSQLALSFKRYDGSLQGKHVKFFLRSRSSIAAS